MGKASRHAKTVRQGSLPRGRQTLGTAQSAVPIGAQRALTEGRHYTQLAIRIKSLGQYRPELEAADRRFAYASKRNPALSPAFGQTYTGRDRNVEALHTAQHGYPDELVAAFAR